MRPAPTPPQLVPVVFFPTVHRPPRPTLFPYTTLFRSNRNVYSTASPTRTGSALSAIPSINGAAPVTAVLAAARALHRTPLYSRHAVWWFVASCTTDTANTACTVRLAPPARVPMLHSTS